MDDSKLIEEIVIFLYNRGFITDQNVQLKEIAEKALPEFEKYAPLIRIDATQLENQLIQSKFIRRKDHNDGSCEFDLAKVLNLRKNIIEKLDMKLQSEVKNTIDLVPESEKSSLLRFTEKDLIFQFNTCHVALKVSKLYCFYCLVQFKSYHDLWKHIANHLGKLDPLVRFLGKYPQFRIRYTPYESLSWRISITGLTNQCLKITNIYVIDKGKRYLNLNLSLKVKSDVHHIWIKNRYFNINYVFPLIIVYEVGRSRFMEMHNFPVMERLSMKKLKIENPLPDYFPSSVAKSMHEGKPVKGLNPCVMNYIDNQKILTPTNICDVFSLLVEMEDWATIKEYEKIILKSVPIHKSEYTKTDDEDEEEYYFEVSKKPDADPISQILKTGDQVILKDPPLGEVILGTISRLKDDSVYFNVETLMLPKIFDISFMPQRFQIQYQHEALGCLSIRENLRMRLFPLTVDSALTNIKRLTFFNSSLAGNPEQRQAVENIIANTNKEVPFILFGPPGTGKTTVIVEALLQLSRGNKEARILVAAGSNAACDEIAVRLAKQFDADELRNHAMLRIYAKSCEKNLINNKIRPVSNLLRRKQYYPSLENIYKYRIVIATLTVVGRLVHGEISEKHFTNVFIDECGSTTEPESLLAICGILSPTSNLILAGDPKQLGPIIQCRKAASYGLDRSLLERLLERDCYKVDSETMKYNKSIQMRLVRNYRSHPSILSLPNMLYYDNQLKALGSSEVVSKGIGWHALPTKNFPVLFKSVNGRMQQLKKLPSYFNQKEIDMVMLYVKDLMFYGILNQKVEQEDIGIISPYKRQYNFLRKELDKRGWYKITTGSVETFQGQEKPIIIATTVRSSVKTPGFLNNPKRLNVLLTRAQSLLIIVGNSRTLYRIGDWKCLIDYCVQNEAFLGESEHFKALQKVASMDLAQAMEKLSVSTSASLVDYSDSDSDESEESDQKYFLNYIVELIEKTIN